MVNKEIESEVNLPHKQVQENSSSDNGQTEPPTSEFKLFKPKRKWKEYLTGLAQADDQEAD